MNEKRYRKEWADEQVKHEHTRRKTDYEVGKKRKRKTGRWNSTSN